MTTASRTSNPTAHTKTASGKTMFPIRSAGTSQDLPIAGQAGITSPVHQTQKLVKKAITSIVHARTASEGRNTFVLRTTDAIGIIPVDHDHDTERNQHVSSHSLSRVACWRCWRYRDSPATRSDFASLLFGTNRPAQPESLIGESNSNNDVTLNYGLFPSGDARHIRTVDYISPYQTTNMNRVYKWSGEPNEPLTTVKDKSAMTVGATI